DALLEILDRHLLYFCTFHVVSFLDGGFDVIAPYNELGRNRKFLRSQTQRLLSYGQGHPLGLEENTPRGYRRHESFGITFTLTHTHLGGFLRDGFVGEDADPELSFTFHITR